MINNLLLRFFIIINCEHRENNTEHSLVYVINKQKYNYSFARHLRNILKYKVPITCSYYFALTTKHHKF